MGVRSTARIAELCGLEVCVNAIIYEQLVDSSPESSTVHNVVLVEILLYLILGDAARE